MAQYANQKQITIQRENVSESKANKRPYLIAYQDNLQRAMTDLTPAAFKVYVALLFNADGYRLDFSPEHIKDLTGLCKDTIRKAMTLLELRGYIKEIDFFKYIFSEKPNNQIHITNW